MGGTIDALRSNWRIRVASQRCRTTGADRAATALRDAVGPIHTAAVGEPAFRLVVTGTGPVLTLDDGTVTCPLRALAP
jgi:hypothetical protein